MRHKNFKSPPKLKVGINHKHKSQILICSQEKLFYSRVRVYLTQNENFKKEPMLDAHCANILINHQPRENWQNLQNGYIDNSNHSHHNEENEEETNSFTLRKAVLFKFGLRREEEKEQAHPQISIG